MLFHLLLAWLRVPACLPEKCGHHHIPFSALFEFFHAEDHDSYQPMCWWVPDLKPSMLSLNTDPGFQLLVKHFQCPSDISNITRPKRYLSSPPDSSLPMCLILPTQASKPETSEPSFTLNFSWNLQFCLQYSSVLIFTAIVQAYTISSLENCSSSLSSASVPSNLSLKLFYTHNLKQVM